MREKINQNPLPVVFLTVLIDLLGYGILIPVIPLLLANPRSEYYLLPKGYSVNDGFVLLGYLLAMYPIGQFLATPILGQLSDIFGRKKILALSLAGTSVSYIIFAIGIITKNIPLLFISRTVDGLTGGNISVAQAAIADVTTPQNRAKNFGLIGAAFGLGFIIGPYIGGKLSDPAVVSWFNASTPFWFAAILSALNVALVLSIFPETIKHLDIHKKIEWGKSILNIAKAYSMKDVRIVYLTNFLFNSGFTFYTSFFSIYLINKFNFSQGNIGDFFSYVGIWIAFTQAVVTRRLSHLFSEEKILRITLMGASLILLIYLLPNVWWQLLFIVPFFAFCIGLTIANSTALISKSVDRSVQGEVLGINASVQALAQAIPAVLSGYIAAHLSPESPILVASLTIVVAGFIFLLFYRPHIHSSSPAPSSF